MVTTHGAHTNYIEEGLFLWEALGASASRSSPTKTVEGTDYAALKESAMSPERAEARVGQCKGSSLSSNPANRLLGFWPECVRR